MKLMYNDREGKDSDDNNNDVPMQSFAESRDTAIPVFLEIGLDRVLEDLGKRGVVHTFRFARYRSAAIDFIDLDLVIVGTTRARSEEDHER